MFSSPSVQYLLSASMEDVTLVLETLVPHWCWCHREVLSRMDSSAGPHDGRTPSQLVGVRHDALGVLVLFSLSVCQSLLFACTASFHDKSVPSSFWPYTSTLGRAAWDVGNLCTMFPPLPLFISVLTMSSQRGTNCVLGCWGCC